MKKLLLLTSTISLIAGLPTLAILSSCSKIKTKDVSYIDKKVYYSDSDEQSLLLTLTQDNISSIEVELDESSTERLFVKETSVFVVDKQAEIVVGLRKTGQYLPETATFNLNLYFKDANDRVIYYQKISDFVIGFRGYNPKDEDVVICQKGFNKTVNGAYSTTFIFSCFEEPKSDFHITLTDKNNVLSLEQSVIKPIRDERPEYQIWYINVKINISLSQFQTKLLDFKLQFDFTNSFGLKQTNVFDKMFIKYYRDRSNIIPIEYYEIKDNELVGIKRDASSARIFEDCQIISIPEGVKTIKAGVFGPANSLELNSPYFNFSASTFSHIKKIILPSSVKNIEEKGFYYCQNINELDVTSYGDELPNWLTANKPIFDRNNFTGYVGYIWTKNKDYESNTFTDHFHHIGLSLETYQQEYVKTKWLVAHQNIVTPENLFKYSEISTTKHIVGVKEDYIDYLWNYKIIKIPDDVTHIDVGSLSETFGKKPYFKGGKSTDLCTRRLILGSGLQTVDPYAFNAVGISGPLLIPTYDGELSNIFKGGSSFHDCYKYDDTISDYWVEDVRLVFEQTNDVVSIPDSFFTTETSPSTMLSFVIQQIVLPKNVMSIGKNAFRHSASLLSKSIKLSENIEEIGESAFEYFELGNTTGEGSEFVIGPSIKKIGKYAFGWHNFKKITFKCWRQYTHYEWEGEEGAKKLYKIEEIVTPSEISSDILNTTSAGHYFWDLDTVDLSFISKESFMQTRKTEVGQEPAEKTYNYEMPSWMSNATKLLWDCAAQSGTIILNSFFQNPTDQKIIDLREKIIKKVKEDWGCRYDNWTVQYK